MPRNSDSGGRDRAVSKELAPDFNSHERTRLKVIWDHIMFLERRIADAPDQSTVTFATAEVAAYRWLLEKAGAPVPPRPAENHAR